MTYVAGIKARFEPLRSAAFGAVGAAYAALGDPLANKASGLYFRSTLDKDVLISFDASDDYLYIGAGDDLFIEFGANKQGDTELWAAKGTQVYQKRGAGGASSSGALYLMVLYGRK